MSVAPYTTLRTTQRFFLRRAAALAVLGACLISCSDADPVDPVIADGGADAADAGNADSPGGPDADEGGDAPADADEGGDAPADASDVASADVDADTTSSSRPAVLAGPLSATGWFVGDVADLTPSDGLAPFDVALPFFSDHVDKQRYAIVGPDGPLDVTDDGATIAWRDGTVLVKVMTDDDTTELPWLEVRALVLSEGRWWPGTWVWDADTGDGRPVVDGATLARLHPTAAAAGVIDYPVPTVAECERCHGGDDPAPLGFVAAQLDRERDPGAASLVAAGVLSRPVVAARRHVDPLGDASVEDRARSWLAVNCSSCHARGEAGARRGLILTLEATTEAELGICRYETLAAPTPADVFWLVSPGDPDASALWYRTATLSERARMPDVPYATVDEDGVALVRQWISELQATPCDER